MASKHKILIIDDEVDFVEVLRTRLEDSDYDVVVAYDGIEGLEVAEKNRPDLVILDIMLPKMDGFDVCRKFKIDGHFKDIPIIMLSAKFQASDIKFGMAMGANAYITKPFEPQVLLDKVRELLKEKQ